MGNFKRIKFSSVLEDTGFFVMVSFFLLFCLFRLDAVSMHDTHEASACVLALDLFDKLKTHGISAFTDGFPSMSMVFFYVGTLQSYMMLPFILVFGQTVFAARILYVICGLLSILSMSYVCGKWFGRRSGQLIAVFMCISSVFIRAVRAGAAQEETLQIFFFWAGLFFVQLGISSSRRRYFFVAAFVFGLGLWAKLVFAGYLLGVIFFVLVLFLSGHCPLKVTFPCPKKRSLAVGGAVLFCFVGALPLLVYNLVSQPRFITLRVIIDAFFRTDRAGNWDVSFIKSGYSLLEMLLLRVMHFHALLSSCVCSRISEGPENIYLPMFFYVALFFVVYKLFRDRNRQRPRDRKLVFIICVYAGMFFANALTPGLAFDYHLIVMLPFVAIICALFFRIVTLMAGDRRLASILFAVLFLPHLVFESVALRTYFNEVTSGRATGEFASYSSEIVEHLLAAGCRRVAVISPGIGGTLRYLAGNKMEVLMDYELWAPSKSPGDFYRQTLAGCGSYHLLRAQRFPHWAVDVDFMKPISKMILSQRRKMRLVKTFRDDNWDVVYELYFVSAPGTDDADKPVEQ